MFIIPTGDIQRRKEELIEKYGLEPTITYYYYLWNAVTYVGEEWLRESFESVRNLDVIVGDNNSNDGTKEIAKEYGFKVITVPRESSRFASGKVTNAVIHNTTSNFLIDLNIHYVYPKIIDEFCKFWIDRNTQYINDKVLILRGKFDGTIRFNLGSWMNYRPYWLAVRGVDERLDYPFCGPYSTRLMLGLWGLKIDEHYIGMVHKSHKHLKAKARRGFTMDRSQRALGTTLYHNIVNDFDKGVKNVKNSYW